MLTSPVNHSASDTAARTSTALKPVDMSILPAAFRKILKILNKNWRKGRLDIVFPNGGVWSLTGVEEGPSAQLQVKNTRFIRRVMASGDIGFCDGYREGEWDTPDLAALLTVLSHNLDKLKILLVGNPLVRAFNNIVHAFNKNTKEGSKRNIFAHYDLGNDFYGQWLDPSMTYSSALFESETDLETAQAAKYAALAKLVDLKPGQHVLEIGCGWGGFAQYAAQTIGAKVTCLTISPAQADYATARMKRHGLDNLVDIRLMDYRDVEGEFDAVVSIEMFEAVGEAYWDAYFDQVKARLKPGGKAGLQIITIRDDLFDEYRQRSDFIQKYIFPGGMLPSLTKLKDQAVRVGLSPLKTYGFALDYAHTLKLWAQRFEAAWKAGRISGFDGPFRKQWLFYLAYCEAGFRTGRTDVIHFGLQRP
ncbi:cyclopropane-fatty-acyl-phospholipid synthase [Asticcacaulis sp. SL142]|uniref:SAM-dependent methyltransferase n=1 Tax=Asticcacaulis sp. SL142 TaxID=2995155 RepID=UPI00226CEBDD|nr:cyclopropane-fatty-acyl-phospholipid synthase family protein [Asticcacaulis sp. SL142]WAC49501.1 cyclopropane-fatty-acyl-phospholipid synthase [Asticcacaulis sp. SL142]